MKYFLTFALIFSLFTASAQDALKIESINRVVASINSSSFSSQKDSTVQDFPNLSLKMNTYLTSFWDGDSLKKYVNHVVSVTKEDGETKTMTTSSSFYFDKNKLIKVEESGIQNTKVLSADWYYENDQPIFWTIENEKSSSRAQLLLTIASELLKKLKNGK